MIHNFGKNEVREELKQVSFSSPIDLNFHSVTLRQIVKRFSAQFIGDVELELTQYFDQRGGGSFNSSYPDLLYFSSSGGPTLSSSVIAGVGEGMAGYLVQYLDGYAPEARPLGYAPDIIMVKQTPLRVALVEAKGTARTNPGDGILAVLRKAALEMIEMLAKAPYLKSAKYTGYIIGTEIVREDDFRCYVLRLEQP
jgi:hypothetical protein